MAYDRKKDFEEPLMAVLSEIKENKMNENLTVREKKMLKVIEGVINGFYDAKMGREFRKTIFAIDEALAEVEIKRTDKDKKLEG